MIYIVRHGQTEANSSHSMQGRSDFPLNGKGAEQAEAVAGWMRAQGISFDAVYSSPLIRAVQTAEIVAGEGPGNMPEKGSAETAGKSPAIVRDERLIEMDYGPYEGTDLNHLPDELLSFFGDFVHRSAPEGMEQLSSVVARAASFLDDLRAVSGNILISTHAIAMKGLLEALTPGSNGSYWSKYIGNCAIYVAENDGGRIGVPREFDPNT